MCNLNSENKDRIIRRCHRVLRMVSELHKLGFQGLRIYPYNSELGHWRLGIYTKNHFNSFNSLALNKNYAIVPEPAIYSSANEAQYFDWTDSTSDNSRQLAKKFMLRYEELCTKASFRDWEYAGWYQELIGTIESGNLLPSILGPSGYGEDIHYIEKYDANFPKFLPIMKYDEAEGYYFDRGFPLPPSVKY